MGHDLRWNTIWPWPAIDGRCSGAILLPPLAFSQTGRIVAALTDASVVLAAGMTMSATMRSENLIGRVVRDPLSRAALVMVLARRVGHRYVCRQSPPGGSRPARDSLAPAKSRAKAQRA
jgi:hypothetical protein